MKIAESYEARELKKRPFVIKIADYLTSVFGSVSFLLFNVGLFAFWILGNQEKIPGISRFDTFPYPLLTTIVSLEAIFLSVIVLMSQNRQSHVSSIREELDMQVNLLAEREVTAILKILKKLADKNNIKIDDAELTEMLESTDVSYIERSLEKQLETPSFKPREMVKEVEKLVLPGSTPNKVAKPGY